MTHAALFGSVARDDQNDASDIDILVDLDPAIVARAARFVEGLDLDGFRRKRLSGGAPSSFETALRASSG